jgi:hypothetical protein
MNRTSLGELLVKGHFEVVNMVSMFCMLGFFFLLELVWTSELFIELDLGKERTF